MTGMLAWRKVTAAAGLGLCVGLTACAAIWGFEDGVLDTAGSDATIPIGNDAGTDAPVTTTDDASDGETPTEDLFAVGENAPPGCAERVVDPAVGIFAHAAVGADTPSCGTQDEPCKSFTAALTQVAAKGPSTKYVYLASGTYTGSVTIPATTPANLVIQGAWRTRTPDSGTGLEWIRDCRKDTASRTVIKGDQAVVVTATGNAGDAGDAGVSSLSFALSNLSVHSKTLAENGESLYGVMVNQVSIRFEDVWLRVEEGGPGNGGITGGVGTPGAATGCAPAAAGPAGTAGAGSSPVAFGPSGITGGAGINGGNGGNGATGTAGVAGACVTCKDTCNVVDTCVGYPAAGKLCGTDGLGGCGGGGGKAGTGGAAGGSSIGVYAWKSQVEYVRTKTITGPGGPGGLGAKGGGGGAPGAGAAGTDTATTCFTDCNALVCATPKKGTGGAAGGTGTAGALGGTGGGGAGGHAFCVVALNGTLVNGVADLDCNAKGGGTGGPVPDGGVPGAAGKSGVLSDGGL